MDWSKGWNAEKIGFLVLALAFNVFIGLVIFNWVKDKKPVPLDMKCHNEAVREAEQFFKHRSATDPNYKPSEEEITARYDLDWYSRIYLTCVVKKKYK